jgi:hypothetical protein
MLGVPSCDRKTQYDGNKKYPNQILAVDAAIQTYVRGYINRKQLNEELLCAGYDIEGFNWNQAVLHNKNPKWGQPNEPLFITNNKVNDLETTTIGSFVAANLFTPSPDELMVMRNRNLLSDTCFRNYINRATNADANWHDMYNELRFIIPGVADLISFAVREAFNTEVITKFGYNKELPIEILPWLEKQGLAGGTNFKMPPNSTTTIGVDTREFAQWFDHYWWAHWQLPSLSSGYEMLHRYYPTSRYGPSPDVKSETGQVDPDLVFTADEMDTLHKTQDYPPYWRKKLSGISYLPLTRVDVRRMRQINVFKNPAEVYHAYRAIGYNDKNAERLAQFTEELVKPKNRKVSQTAAKLICQANGYKLITDIQAISKLRELGYNEDDATAFLVSCKLDAEIKESIRLINMLKKLYLKGFQPYEPIRLALVRMGISNDDAYEMTRKWDIERNLKWRELTVSQLRKALKENVIDDGQFRKRLQNFGYRDTDIDIEIETLQMELDREYEQTVKKSLVYFNPKKIGDLYDAGILEKDDILQILTQKQWSKLAIDSFLLENKIE